MHSWGMAHSRTDARLYFLASTRTWKTGGHPDVTHSMYVGPCRPVIANRPHHPQSAERRGARHTPTHTSQTHQTQIGQTQPDTNRVFRATKPQAPRRTRSIRRYFFVKDDMAFSPKGPTSASGGGPLSPRTPFLSGIQTQAVSEHYSRHNRNTNKPQAQAQKHNRVSRHRFLDRPAPQTRNATKHNQQKHNNAQPKH